MGDALSVPFIVSWYKKLREKLSLKKRYLKVPRKPEMQSERKEKTRKA